MSLIKPTDLGSKFLSKQSTPADLSAISAVQLYERQVGSDGASGNTVFSLTKYYLPGSHTLMVFLNGQKLEVDDEYTETNALTVTFASALQDADVIEFMVMGHYRVADSELESALGQLPDYTNLLINPQFTINQRGYAGGALGAAAYGYDRWRANGAGVSSLILSGDTLTITADGLVQLVESGTLVEGQEYTVSWLGTSQVYDFDASAYTSGVQSLTFTYTAANWGSNALIIFGAGTLQQPMLVAGSHVIPFQARRVADELALCQRYYEKSYPLATAPGSTNLAGAYICVIHSSWLLYAGHLDFTTPKASTPTMYCYSTYDGALGYGGEYNSAGTFVANRQMQAAYSSDSGGAHFAAAAAGMTAGNFIRIHWVADAEL